jgi:hypothetical protein
MTDTNENTGLILEVSVEGKIIKSNFDAFRVKAEAKIDSINLTLTTDEHFLDAKQDVKDLAGFEKMLVEAEDQALQQMDEVHKFLTGNRDLKKLSSKTRLELSKTVKRREDEIKTELLKDGYAALVHDLPQFRTTINESIKGKRSLTLMKQAVDDTVETINAGTSEIEHAIDAMCEEHGTALGHDRKLLYAMSVDTAKSEIERRIERHLAAIETARLAEIAKVEREKNEKLEREAAEAKLAAERETAKEAVQEPILAPDTTAPVEVPYPDDEDQAEPQEAPKEEAQTFCPKQERKAFVDTLATAFIPVRAARNALTDPTNIADAEAFADAMSEAFHTHIGA